MIDRALIKRCISASEFVHKLSSNSWFHVHWALCHLSNLFFGVQAIHQKTQWFNPPIPPPPFFGEWVFLSVTTLFCSLKKQRKTKRSRYPHIYNVIWTLPKTPCTFPEFHEPEWSGRLSKGAPWVMYSSNWGALILGSSKSHDPINSQIC